MLTVPRVFLAVFATLLLGCGGEKEPEPPAESAKAVTVTRPKPVEDVLGSVWCRDYGCTFDTTVSLRDGNTNNRIDLGKWPDVITEVVTAPDRSLAYSGLVVVTGGDAPPADLVDRFRGFVEIATGECAGLAAHLRKAHTLSVSGIMDAKPLRCGPYEVRAGKIGVDYNLSIDKAK